jgi:hypothetical protein
MWDLGWTTWHWVFPCQFHSTGAPLQGKTKKLIIFITGLHNQPQGCGASAASAAGPFSTKKNTLPHTSVPRSSVLRESKHNILYKSSENAEVRKLK